MRTEVKKEVREERESARERERERENERARESARESRTGTACASYAHAVMHSQHAALQTLRKLYAPSASFCFAWAVGSW